MRLAVALVILSASAVAHAGGFAGIIVPPAEVDYGVGPVVGGASAVTGPSQELLAGVHWASLYWKPTDLDVGAGYVGISRPVLPGYAKNNLMHADGAYFDVAYTLERHRHWRTWLSGRVEYLSSGPGVAVRIANEVYSHAVGGAGGGNALAVVAGTFALGFYVEASHRSLEPELGPNAVTAGVSVRVPFMMAVGG